MLVVGWRGHEVELLGSAELVHAVGQQLPPFWTSSAARADSVVTKIRLMSVRDRVRVELSDGLGYEGPRGAESERAIASRIELFLVSRLTDVAPVHAGVVACEGRAIVVPGASMSGKSTLVHALLGQGATYLSDEFALITVDGLVCAYPRLMTIRRPGGGSDRVEPAVRAGADADAMPVAVIAALRWSPKGESIHTQSPAQAMLHLVANSVTVRRDQQRTIAAFAATARRAFCLNGFRSDAEETARRLIALALAHR